jgi:hypothetical protein
VEVAATLAVAVSTSVAPACDEQKAQFNRIGQSRTAQRWRRIPYFDLFRPDGWRVTHAAYR